MPSWKKLLVSGSDAAIPSVSTLEDFTIDAGGDIILDADGTDIIFKDGGTEFGSIKRVSSDFVIKSATSNKDIVFKGNDNGSTITPFTLDMSDGGKAKFEGGVSGSFEGDGSGLTGISASPFVTTPLSLTSNFTTTANTLNVVKSLASDPFTIEDGVTLTITATSIVEVEEV